MPGTLASSHPSKRCYRQNWVCATISGAIRGHSSCSYFHKGHWSNGIGEKRIKLYLVFGRKWLLEIRLPAGFGKNSREL
jgi:hypothetical protein